MKATPAQDSAPLSQQVKDVLWISVQRYYFSSKQRRHCVSLRDGAVCLAMDAAERGTTRLAC